jgi:putative ABC transport system permease protein
MFTVLAFDVTLRQHELGVRSALGADVSRIVGMVFRQALVLVGLGIVIGIAVSRAGARFVEPLLLQVSGDDGATYILVAAVLIFVAGAAGALPAWRAARVDPKEALQAD